MMFRRSRQERFWSWFRKQETALFDADPADPIYVRDLTAAMRRVHAALVWQVTPARNGCREFVISADGILEAFSAVESLAAAAPELRRWEVIRFRPREPDYDKGGIRIGNYDLKAGDIECSLTSNGRQIGVEVFVRGRTDDEDDRLDPAVFVLLDAALGECDIGCNVAAVMIRPFEHPCPPNTRFPFSDLRMYFDALVDELCDEQ